MATIGMQWNVLKFDYSTGAYTGTFWDLDDVDYFVDSDPNIGSDLNAGTYDAPFATISKIKALGAGIWEDGLVIMVNGIFTENLDIDKAVRIVGAGGYNGRAIFNNGGGSNYVRYTTTDGAINSILDNIELLNYTTTLLFYPFSGFTGIAYASNCIFKSAQFRTANIATATQYQTYHCLFNQVYLNVNLSITRKHNFTGNNNVLYDCTVNPSYTSVINISGNNNHVNNSITIASDTGSNNILNTDARYFTDSGEGTIAELYINPTLNDFNFPKTVSIWDKTAGETITINPLYRAGTFNVLDNILNHVGCGYEGVSSDASDTWLKSTDDGGDATYDNISTDGYNLYRTNDGIDGVLTTGIKDLGAIIDLGLGLRINHTFAVDAGEITKRVQTTGDLTYRQGFDIVLQYGNTEAQVADCPELLMEFGKTFSVSGSNASRKGNADVDFDPATATSIRARYIKMKITLRNS